MGKIGAVVVAGCLFLGTFVVAEVVSVAARPQTPQEIQAQLEKEVAEIKPTLPRQEGDAVTWFDVAAEWQTIVYKYKIHAPRETVVAKKQDLEGMLKGNVMIGAARMMLPKGVKLKYELYDDGGGYIYSIDGD